MVERMNKKQQELEQKLAELEEEIKAHEVAVNQYKLQAIAVLEELASYDKKYRELAHKKAGEWGTIEPFSS